MPADIAPQASLLIGHIQDHFHAGHRRALPELLAMAAALEARGLDDSLVDKLQSIGDALEQHMFKEEMRLFPMMEQGGNTLIKQLIEDLHREHVVHEDALHDLHVHLGALSAAFNADRALQQLVQAVDALAHALRQHIRAEDEDLFPLFLPPDRTAGGAAFKP